MTPLSYYFEQRPIESGGANVIQVVKTCDAFVRQGVPVTLYAPAGRGVTGAEIRSLYGLNSDIDIRPIKTFNKVKFILNTFSMLCHLMKDNNRAVFTRNIYFAFLASFSDKTVIYEAHQYAYPQFYHTVMQIFLLKRLAGKKNFRMVAISEHLKRKLREKGVESPVLVCHDGYEDTAADKGAGVKVERGRFKAVAAYAGSLLRIKGLGHIERLAACNPEVKFYVIGDLDFHADREITGRLGRMPNVSLTGQVRHTDIQAYLRAADILLLLPTRDGVYNDVTSPLKLFEYMSAGKAILSTDMPSLREVLRHGENALMAQDDAGDIDEKFMRLVNDPRLRARLGGRAGRDVRRFSWNTRARRIKEYLSGSPA